MTDTPTVIPHASATRRRILACVLPAMLLPMLASLLYYVLLAGHPVANVIYGAAKVFTIVFPIIAVLAVERRRFRRTPIDWPKHLAAFPLGIATGLLIATVILGGYFFTGLGDYARNYAADVTTKINEMGIGTPPRYIIFCTFLAAIHSLIEEFFWRWYVFGRLAVTMPRAAAYLIAGFAFAAHHYVILACYFSPLGTILFGTGVATGGILWSWQLRRQRTLAGAWLSHALVDVAIFIVGYQLVFA